MVQQYTHKKALRWTSRSSAGEIHVLLPGHCRKSKQKEPVTTLFYTVLCYIEETWRKCKSEKVILKSFYNLSTTFDFGIWTAPPLANLGMMWILMRGLLAVAWGKQLLSSRCQLILASVISGQCKLNFVVSICVQRHVKALTKLPCKRSNASSHRPD